MSTLDLGGRVDSSTLVTVGGFIFAGALAAGIVVVSPVMMLAATLGVAGVLFFLVRPTETLLAAIIFRVFLDILWWVPFSVGGLNLSQIFSGGVFVMLSVIAFLRMRALRHHPVTGWALAMIALLSLATARAIDLAADVDILVRYFTAPLMLLATALVFDKADQRRRLVWLITLAAVVPVAYSMFKLATGMSGYVLHGYARLLGGYKNIHNHALVMMCFAMLFLGWTEVVERRWLRLSLYGLVGACLLAIYFTYTRTGMLGVAVAILAYLIARRRYRLVGAALLAGSILVLLDPEVQDRFSDLLVFFDPDADKSQMRSLGSGRWGLWSWSMAEYTSKSWAEMLFGLGLGGHRITTLDWSRAFHRIGLTLDPHNDYLLFLYQMGPLGVIVYLGMVWGVVRSGLLVLRHGSDRWSRGFAASMVGLSLGVVVTNGVSNSFIHRSAPGWYYWSLAGLVVAEAIAVKQRLVAEGKAERRPRLVAEPGEAAAPA